jgi:hypothetical protein
VYVVLMLRNLPSKKFSELTIISLVFLSGEAPKAGVILRKIKIRKAMISRAYIKYLITFNILKRISIIKRLYFFKK